jgi:hypothetical protein
MNRVYRCLPAISLFTFALLLVLPGLAAAEENPRAARARARADFEAVAPDQAKCGGCVLAHKSCSDTCFGLRGKEGMGICLTACDNAAATCSCDQAPGVRSEEFVNFEWPSVAKAACHGTVSCQPNYPSCASWSGYSNCDDPFCGFGPKCGGQFCDEWGFCWWEPGPAIKQRRERFRVCWDQFTNPCTEWQQTLTSTCDEFCDL